MEISKWSGSRRAWDAIVTSETALIHQTSAYATASGAAFQRFVLRNGNQNAHIQVISRRPLPYTNIHMLLGHPIGFEDQETAVRNLARVLPSGILFWIPERPKASHNRPSFAVLPLARNIDKMRNGLSQKWRNRLNSAVRNKIIVGQSRDLNWIMVKERENRIAKGYRGYPIEFIKKLCASREDTFLLTAEHSGNRLAAGLFFVSGSYAHYLIGWSNEFGRKLNAQNLVLWTAMSRLADLGVENLDLGLIDKRLSPGLSHFKLGTGAQTRNFSGARFLIATGRKELVSSKTNLRLTA